MQARLPSISMELRYLANDDRIMLWRNTIQLFHRYNQNDFVGPFYKAGYTDYRIESRLMRKDTGNEVTPDIIATGPDGWFAIDLSGNTDQKAPQLDSYKTIDPRSLTNYGLGRYTTPPDTMSSRLSPIDDGEHCQIIVKNRLDVIKELEIQNQVLKEALVDTKGKDISQLPEIPICFVPESKHFEIRRGLIDIVLQIFSPDCKGKTPYDMCQEGLERLFDNTSLPAVKGLNKKIQTEMDELIKNELKGYLEFKDGKYCAVEGLKDHPRSREAITKKLQDWANPKNRTLYDFKYNQ